MGALGVISRNPLPSSFDVLDGLHDGTLLANVVTAALEIKVVAA